MSDDWHVGDLALCVRCDDGWRRPSTGQWTVGPRPGSVNRVVGIIVEPDCSGLILEDYPGDEGYCSQSFRRIPPHTPDAEDRETIDLLNRAPQPVSV